ncbi:CDP-6-deoxy-delta-3,4-glucoseen reductase [Verticiella sediminum]|uniref:CDP-6-deoxy-delta-3,4-glucoseen reductase n=1 Tax=Verticiella sediminum TaxID=1247510 RepID=A0A556AVT0_9BURK|nr:CDP-6-deoxy-delta-3,4-glucoseen reductase [Verticiella sediminum]TSH97063.1 CDP-6-deoxy-delta-3,4-glucoseen reductase [Verticiella sediminum]
MSHRITVLPSNHQFYAAPGESILDAALNAGVTLPYSCKNGACSSCKGRVVDGEFEQLPHQPGTLHPEDAAQGYALFCCAVPQSDLTVEARVVQGMDGIEIRKMPVRVQALERLGEDVMLVRLQMPANQRFVFNAGQYLELILKDGRRRSYSMASAPHVEGTVELHIRHMPGGAFTDRLFGAAEPSVKAREILRCEAPLGSFFLREDTERPIVLLASGTGFAPIKAMVEHMIHKGMRRTVRLYWGGRRPRDLYLGELAQSWAGDLPDYHYVPVVSDAQAEDAWTGRTGFVHHAVMQDIPDLSEHEVYACGAPAMVEAARRDFTERCGLPTEAFFADAFTSEADLAAAR